MTIIFPYPYILKRACRYSFITSQVTTPSKTTPKFSHKAPKKCRHPPQTRKTCHSYKESKFSVSNTILSTVLLYIFLLTVIHPFIDI